MCPRRPSRDVEAAGHGTESRAEVWWKQKPGDMQVVLRTGDEVIRKGRGVAREKRFKDSAAGCPALGDQGVQQTPAGKLRGDQ